MDAGLAADQRHGTLQDAYAEALHDHVVADIGNALAQAYEIGRAALTSGTSMMRLVATHQAELVPLIQGVGLTDDERSARLDRATEFLSECLAPFEIAHRGYREAATVLSELSVLDLANDAIVVRDLDGTVTYWNQGAQRLYGWPRSEALGATLHDLLRTVLADPLHVVTAELEASGHWTGRVTQCTRAGNEVTVETHWTARRDHEGTTSAVLEISTDITHKLEAERAVRQALEAERASVARLREADDLKNGFLQAVSHELRTPLTSILGFAHTLQASADAIQPQQRRLFLERMVVNADKLNRLLEDLLDVDRLTHGAADLMLQPTDLDDLVARYVAALPAIDPPITTDLRPCRIHIDPAKIERIVDNLIANARRHTPPGTPIHVTVRATSTGGGRLTVEDAGPGIPDHLKTEVFAPFRQGPAAARDPSPGTGIGLAIVDRFADLHGGRAWIEDREGGGTRVLVDLPAGP